MPPTYNRRGGHSSWRSSFANSTLAATPAPLLGPILSSLTANDLEESAKYYSNSSSITNCSFIASFNWLESNSKNPTVLVPGKPPRWTPAVEVVRLKEDSGRYFRDQNAARYSQHPWEPAVLALLSLAPDFKADFDVVACGNTIGNLLRFVRGQDKTFRMLIEVVNETVFFIRRENTPTEIIPDVRGFGHAFPEAYTTWDPDVKGSASHQRLITYNFGGQNILLRFESDGYLPEKTDLIPLQSTFLAGESLSLNDLALDITAQQESNITSQTQLKIKKAGYPIAHNLIFDLKTRSHRKKQTNVLSEELPRLWLCQIQNFILAYHTNGVFRDIDIQDVSNDVRTWEKDHKHELGMLATLIDRLVKFARAKTDGRLEICHSKLGVLELREQLPDAGEVLSSHARLLWLELAQSKSANQLAADYSLDWDDNDVNDFTACTELCDYCGTCR